MKEEKDNEPKIECRRREEKKMREKQKGQKGQKEVQ